MPTPTTHDPSVRPASIPALVAGFASVYIIWGSTYLAIKFAVDTLPPFLMAGSRFITAGVVLWIILAMRGQAPRPTLRQFGQASIIGMLLLTGANGLVTWSEQQGAPSGIAALIVGTMPLWMVLFDWIMNRRRTPSLLVFLGLAVGFAGVALLATQDMNGSAIAHDETSGAAMTWPIIALLTACVLWSYGSLRSGKVDQGNSLMLASAMQMIGGGTAMIILGSAFGEWPQIHLDAVSLKSVAAFVYLIIFGSLVGFTSYVWLLKHASPTAVSTYAFVNPVVAVFLGFSLGNEPITLTTVLAGTMIVGAVVLMLRRKRTHAAPKPAAAAPCEVPDEELPAIAVNPSASNPAERACAELECVHDATDDRSRC